jgi:hypothetical protein
MLDSESKLREAIQKMLNPETPSTEESTHADRDTKKDSESMDDLFDDEKADDKESLEGLFEEDDSKK